jgi:hypothetical protein
MNVNDVGNAAQNGLNRFFEFLPQLLGAIVIFIIGWFIAIGLAKLVTRLLHMAHFDDALLDSPVGRFVGRVFASPAHFVGRIVYWLVLLGGLSIALSSLNITALNAFLGAIYGYLPHVIAALVIFLVAGFVSVAAAAFVGRVMGPTALAKGIAAVVPTIVMSIAMFMILNELQIAKEIVNITYTALIGSIALGMALAFGLGGRDVAARMLETAYETGRRNAGTVKNEVSRAAENTKTEVRRARRNAR